MGVIKYITILESDNSESPNIGTITNTDINNKFKEAIQSHFDAELISFSFVDKDVVKLDDCINASPIDVLVKLDDNGEDFQYKVELSQTWLY